MNAQPQTAADAGGRLADLVLALLGDGVAPAAQVPEAAWLRDRARATPAADPATAWERWCAGPPPADRTLHALCAMLRLDLAECLAVALAAEVEVDPMSGRALAWMQAPVAGARPSLGLLATMAARIDGDTGERHLASLLSGRACECGLLLPARDSRCLPETSVSMPVPLALALRGLRSRWPGVDTGMDDAPPLAASTHADAARYARAVDASGRPLAIRSGHPLEARAAAQAVASCLGAEAAFVEGEPDPGLGPWLWLGGRVPVLCREPAPGERQRLAKLPGYPGALLVATGPDGSFEYAGAPVAQWTLAIPPVEERVALWRQATGDADLAQRLGDRGRHGAARIHALARAGRFEAMLDGGRGLDDGHLLDAGRGGAAADLGTLAQLLPEPIPGEALVLPPVLQAELDALLARCQVRDGLAGGLGPALRTRYRPGVRALLYGPSGTGKTLAAGWLATRLGLPLYRVDLASVTSKYIGETEKNLAELFARAEHADVVLLFDEADALFGKRTDVKDANDRFANAQTNYLLQRIESFEGIAVLASNSRARFDSAFSRRLDAIVEFQLPSPEERRALWQAHLGDGHGLGVAGLNRLAANCELAGGHVRNIVLAAAARARAGGRAIVEDDLLAAAAAEYRKLGKAVPHGMAAARE